MKLEIVVVYLQSYARMFLAKLLKNRLKQQKSSVVVQKILRRYLAKKTCFRLRSEAYDLLKLNKLKLIQHHARLFIGKQRRQDQMKADMATRVKKFIKGRLAFFKVKEFMIYVRKVRLIQDFYRGRLLLKHKKAVLVQKHLRGLAQFKRFNRLRHVKAGNKVITLLQNRRRKQKALKQWKHVKFIQEKATLIQRAVRAHLKKRRVTMSRTRCVQFYWRKISRLVKYFGCVDACRKIKHHYRQQVLKIQRQYKVFRLRRSIAQLIKTKKAKVIQRLLRRVINRNQIESYNQNMKQILTI